MSRAQLKPLTDIVELDRQSSVDIDPALELEEEKKFVMQDARLGLGQMTDCPVDVQLRWANLRARAHHVRGPKKSPRKIVLKRMIMRKAEEAQRKTTLSVKRKRSI